MGLAHRLAFRALRPLLFSMDGERAHDYVMSWLSGNRRGLTAELFRLERVDDPVELAGLVFPNRVGLAAGLDKEARCLPAFASMGFGSVEVGSVAPKGEVWSDPPRIYRLPQARALINRIGLHRGGVGDLCAALASVRKPLDARSLVPVRIGINLACNATTPAEQAANDYAVGMRATISWADYFTINVSNPNASNRHVPTERLALEDWLAAIDHERSGLRNHEDREPPVFLKLSPDLDESHVRTLCESVASRSALAAPAGRRWGLIVANSSSRREAVRGIANSDQRGGLSGAPLFEPVNVLVRFVRTIVGTDFPIIGTGGIFSGADACGRLEAGADIVQLYTGLIYRGPDLVREVAQALRGRRGL